MPIIKIDKDYIFPDDWKDLTCKKAAELFKIALPSGLKEHYNYLTKKRKELPGSTDEELNKIYPNYFGEVISVIADVPHEVVKKISKKDRYFIYNEFCEKFILGIWYEPFGWKSKGIEFIECEGEKLYFPKPKVKLNIEIPMDVTVFEFAESVDLENFSNQFAGGRYEVAPNIAAILCRPTGEEYDEETSLERAKKLQDMDMDTVWEVFFCLIELLNLQEKHALTFLTQNLMQKQKLSLLKLARKVGTAKYSMWVNRLKALKN